ncbi:MAG: efflux RND transporter periplasmic adaptor subunit [Planctomycetaceae bacterium]
MSDQTANSPTRSSVLVSRFLSAVFLFAVVGGGWLIVQRVTSTPDEAAGEPGLTELVEAVGNEMKLPPQKVTKASFVTEAVAIHQIDHLHTMSGRLAYDEAHHIELKAPVQGVLLDVYVKPGDEVTEGQVLATINSPEIGQARAAVLNETAALQIVQRRVERLQEVTTNLRSLFEVLDRNMAVEQIEAQFNDKLLGDYREDIMSAYSERLLAGQLASSARSATESGSLPLKTMRERDNDRHVTEARFRSARESTAYDVTLQTQELKAELADAERKVMIAKNHLQTLLGFADDNVQELSSDALSKLEVRAPFAGTIEARFLAKSERVRQSDSLFVLANTDSLYVLADIRENDWAAMSVKAGQEVTVEAPAIPDRTFVAKVHYVGREVAVDSNSLPLVATINNSEGLLRPGMFVRVSVPVEEPISATAVRPASVLQHENEKFVFVAVSDDTFRRVDVATGRGNEQWVQITEGLNVGQPVVTDGAFLLKSELLLAGEE